MKKKLVLVASILFAAFLIVSVYFYWSSKQKESPVNDMVQKDTVVASSVITTSEKTFDSTAMIAVRYDDLPEEKMDEFRQMGSLSQGEYLSDQYFEMLKAYFITNVLDTFKIESYGDPGHLKQRYFFFVYNSLPGFVDRKEKSGGYYEEASQSVREDKKLLAYSIYRIDRSPKNIRKIYEMFKPTLTDYVNLKLYTALGIKQSIHSLLDTYQYIQEMENGGALLDSVYLAVDSVAQHYDYEARSAYGHSLDSDYGIYYKHLKIEKYLESHRDAYDPLWAFSFWVRRHHEKNEEEVYKILRELREIFEVEN